jgi:hypothetical protein
MKKYYIIKYADGRDCREINSYESRNEASDALMKYLYSHNEYLSVNDDNYLSPFDFKIEEVDVKDVNEVITDFESARNTLSVKPNADFYVVKRKHSEKVAHLQEVARLVTDINPKHIEALIALNELFTIAEAWNKEDGFVPDFSDRCQDKWIPWFDYDKNTARFMFRNTFNAPTNAYNFSSRLCFKTFARAKQFGKQFADLYNEVFL